MTANYGPLHMRFFTVDDAKKLQCRQIPMLVLPGQIHGQVNVVAPTCEAQACMHWRWHQEPKAMNPDEPGIGCCGLTRT